MVLRGAGEMWQMKPRETVSGIYQKRSKGEESFPENLPRSCVRCNVNLDDLRMVVLAGVRHSAEKCAAQKDICGIFSASRTRLGHLKMRVSGDSVTEGYRYSFAEKRLISLEPS
jgi:hypothetical protein